ncbi:hypothetical protein M6B38_262550 [Iris pallida]|uniref:Uncharacterized protein n=1 Tax=Iris pallida TaxID=29817 RepID=A0AAX6ID30_IRIPA|nr:hypothetical protein M6B38_262550 [Iris pallida]
MIKNPNPQINFSSSPVSSSSLSPWKPRSINFSSNLSGRKSPSPFSSTQTLIILLLPLTISEKKP